MYAKAQQILLAIRQQGGETFSQRTFTDIAQAFPWYATAWLGAAMENQRNNDYLQKAALTINDPLRLQLLLHPSVSPPPTNLEMITAPALEEATKDDTTVGDSETIEAVEAIQEKEESLIEEPAIEIPEAAIEVPIEPDVVDANPAIAVAQVEPATTADEEMLFQPYYTVDYFASQGIKVEGMLQTTNRFDRQLMSFTQWLKTMKKLNFEGENKANDPAVDAQASASVVPKDVVTEAMAEVLEKQGKWDQAIALYAKLTLLHPEKSAFFATQIQKIKERQ